jgi:hypothetical protein
MKTRNGLVSNSSSSSFICDRPIAAVSHDLYAVVCNCDNPPTKYWKKIILNNIKKLCKQDDVQTGENGICFPAVIGETFVIVSNGTCYINTCNNCDWDMVDGLRTASEEEMDKMMEYEFFYYIHHNNLLLSRETKSLEENSDINLICPKCLKKWGKQNPSKAIQNEMYYIDKNENTYCPEHFCKMKVEDHIT